MYNPNNDYVMFKFALNETVNVIGTEIIGTVVEQRQTVKIKAGQRIVETSYLVSPNKGSYSTTYTEEKLRYPDELDFKAQYAMYYNFIDIYLGVDNELVKHYQKLLNELVESKKVKVK